METMEDKFQKISLDREKGEKLRSQKKEDTKKEPDLQANSNNAGSSFGNEEPVEVKQRKESEEGVSPKFNPNKKRDDKEESKEKDTKKDPGPQEDDDDYGLASAMLEYLTRNVGQFTQQSSVMNFMRECDDSFFTSGRPMVIPSDIDPDIDYIFAPII